jgi:type IV pilus assembly protein PilM
LTSVATNLGSHVFEWGPVRRIDHWLHAVPHPKYAVEIAPSRVAAARWTRRQLDCFRAEEIAAGAITPSPLESNIANAEVVRGVLRRVLSHVPNRPANVALLIPDPAVRVFILPFETFPRRAEEALPLLRWRLKKSVPFDVEETVISWSRQTGRRGGLEIVAAVARKKIIREYEEIVESLDVNPGVVLSSTLSVLSLLEDRGATLLVRLSGQTLTTVVVQGGSLCVYRSTEMSADPGLLEPQAVLDEIFPALAFFQDTSGDSADRIRISGFGSREEIFHRALSEELKCPVDTIAGAEIAAWLDDREKDMVSCGLEALAGWIKSEGS